MLISSRTDNPDYFFDGYAYIGPDLVFGPSGVAEYSEVMGQRLGSDEDGCYVVAVRDRDGFSFGTDYAGYKKLFYYWSSRLWAVSDSFIELTSFLRQQGERIRPRYTVLSAMSRGPALQQLASHSTAAEGIHLVPLNHRLEISNNRCEIVPTRSVRRAAKGVFNAEEYGARLREHLALWVSRFEHWLTDPELNLTFDLTGGLDSRVNFAMYLAARERLRGSDTENVPLVRCGSTPDNRDLEVATKITSMYDVDLNVRPSHRPTGAALTRRQRYERWRGVALGTYSPIYFPTVAPDPQDIRVGGGAAGNHRPFYEMHIKSGAVRDFVERTANRLQHVHLVSEFKRDLSDFFDSLGPNITESQKLIEHYRHFRGRIHAGRDPQYRVLFTPFASQTMDRSYGLLDRKRILNGQMNYDMIASLAPALLDVEFDEPYKQPTESIREQATVVQFDAPVRHGRVWGRADHAKPLDEGIAAWTEYDYLRRDYEEAIEDPFVRSFWPAAQITAATEAMRQLDDLGRFKHASVASPVTAILLSREVSPYM